MKDDPITTTAQSHSAARRRWPSLAAALMFAAALAVPSATHAANDALFDLSIDDGKGDSAAATLDLGSTAVPVGGGYVYDPSNQWKIDISSATGALAALSGLTLSDAPYGDYCYLGFNASGAVTSAYLYDFQDPGGKTNFYSNGPGANNTFYEVFSPSFQEISGNASYAPVSAAPEPSTTALALLALGGAGVLAWRKRRALAAAQR